MFKWKPRGPFSKIWMNKTDGYRAQITITCTMVTKARVIRYIRKLSMNIEISTYELNLLESHFEASRGEFVCKI